MKTKGTLKLNKKFWPDIVSGKKKYEFRKLKKGFETGWYEVHDMDMYDRLGHIYLKPIAVNPHILLDSHFSMKDYGRIYVGEAWYSEKTRKDTYIGRFDKDSYDFVKNNYVDKDIDFVMYEITEVKESE